jgi:AcrR family transcriptional regulator
MPTTTSKLANARSRRTHAALLSAAHAILKEEGFEALTMTAVAGRAGVTRRAAYMHFPTRGALVGEMFDHVAGVEGLAESLERVWAAPDALAALDEWAAHLARYHPRLLAVDRALQRVWRTDPDAAGHRKRVVAEKLANTRRLARRLADEGRLADRWTTASAADMLFALIASDVIEALIVDRRWSRQRLADHLAALFRGAFANERWRGTPKHRRTRLKIQHLDACSGASRCTTLVACVPPSPSQTMSLPQSRESAVNARSVSARPSTTSFAPVSSSSSPPPRSTRRPMTSAPESTTPTSPMQSRRSTGRPRADAPRREPAPLRRP